MRALCALGLVLVGLGTGCYHYTFLGATAPGYATRTYKIRRATYLNGFVGNGRVDTRAYCEAPVKTELRVTAADVAIGVLTLLIVTPHTLYVTCPVPARPLPTTSAGVPRTRM